MEETENLSELYYSKLKTSDKPGILLAQFYGEIFHASVGRSEIIYMNRLVKMFGRFCVFFAIMDISRKESFPEFPFGLLYKICQNRLESSTQEEISSSAFSSLDRLITELEKDIEKVKPIDSEKASKIWEKGENK